MNPTISILTALAVTAVTADRAFAQFRGRGGMRHYSPPQYDSWQPEQQRDDYRYTARDDGSGVRDAGLGRATWQQPGGESRAAAESRDNAIEATCHVQQYPYTPIGNRVSTLPSGCRPLPGLRRPYYYWGGNYYAPGDDSSYETVAAPIGATIDALPAGYVTVASDSTTYYYYGGAFYAWDPTRNVYVVVAGPSGAVVPAIPTGYSTELVGGRTYFAYGGVHYRPVWQNGKRCYSVVHR